MTIAAEFFGDPEVFPVYAGVFLAILPMSGKWSSLPILS